MSLDNPHGPIRGDRAYLVQPAENQTYAIAHAPFRIGRDASNHLQVRDSEVSDNHAEVRFDSQGHMVHALGSSTTTVNGSAVVGSVLLSEGDVIGIGQLRLRYTKRSPTGAIVTEAGRGEDISVSEAPTEQARRLDIAAGPRDRPRTAMIIVVSATILLIVWALASLMVR